MSCDLSNKQIVAMGFAFCSTLFAIGAMILGICDADGVANVVNDAIENNDGVVTLDMLGHQPGTATGLMDVFEQKIISPGPLICMIFAATCALVSLILQAYNQKCSSTIVFCTMTLVFTLSIAILQYVLTANFEWTILEAFGDSETHTFTEEVSLDGFERYLSLFAGTAFGGLSTGLAPITRDSSKDANPVNSGESDKNAEPQGVNKNPVHDPEGSQNSITRNVGLYEIYDTHEPSVPSIDETKREELSNTTERGSQYDLSLEQQYDEDMTKGVLELPEPLAKKEYQNQLNKIHQAQAVHDKKQVQTGPIPPSHFQPLQLRRRLAEHAPTRNKSKSITALMNRLSLELE